ncbi:DnaJ subfamily B member 2 [Umbelopsis sp. WA50703]
MDDLKHQSKNLYYEQLNCVPESNLEQIRAEYRKLVLRFHPDKAATGSAYEVLSDPSKRAIYDRWRTSNLQVPFDVFQGLGSHAQTLHWQSLPSQQTITLNSSSSSDNISYDAQVNQTIPHQNDRTIQIGSAWKKNNSDELYSQFRNYEV